MFAKTGPGRNSNSWVWLRKMLTPVRSLGSRSGVNSRDVLDEEVPLGEEHGDGESHELGSSGDDLLDLPPDAVRGLDELGELGRTRCSGHHVSFGV
jgi:hypothetical protein